MAHFPEEILEERRQHYRTDTAAGYRQSRGQSPVLVKVLADDIDRDGKTQSHSDSQHDTDAVTKN